jgi:exopolyphosphatase/guanosine-5'-triphosphate,3'-diphosphate pyrophosphatase
MPVFGAVDIGANSVRLKLARIVNHRLKTIHEDRVVTRLGESVFRSGLLSPDAMETTIKVLRRFHRAAQKHGADQVRVVATSALRDARNATVFQAWTASTTGGKIETIPGLEEGRLIHLGVLANARVRPSSVLLMDLGGGSCELTISVRSQIREIFSLPLGAVRLTQEFLLHDPPRTKELARLRHFIGDEVTRVSERIRAAKVQQIIATSGTAAALAAAASNGRIGAASSVRPRTILKLAEMLAGLNLRARGAVPGIGPRRAEIIVAGSWVFAELLARCDLPGFRYSPLGLRDGVLAQMLADYDRRSSSHRQLASERWEAIVAMCERYHVDMQSARYVRDRVLELFHELRRVHGLPAEYETWLSTAAMLYEVGRFLNHAGWHRHTYYVISNSEIFGFTPDQRQVIACIARYLGKSKPSPGDPPMEALGRDHQELVPKAVVLLRLARAMNQSRERRLRAAQARIDDAKVRLKLKAGRTAPDLELWALQKERGYFRESFGRELLLELA